MSRPQQSKWVEVSRREPCPICGKPDYCTRSTDGQVVKCMRVESDHAIASGGWLHKLTDALPPAPAPKPIQKKRDWTAECRRMYRHQSAKRKRVALAKSLGVSVLSLDLLRVGIGWDQHNGHEFSSWPSRDHTGMCIGYVRRYDDGTKRTNRGGSTGLFYAANWFLHSGPILVVEGGSDVAACISHDLCAIGRPNNVYGARWIRRMLRAHASDRTVVVVGERDAKPEKRGTVSQCPPNCRGCAFCWPGLFGMQKVARELRCAHLQCAELMVPPPYKDMREFLTAGDVDDFLNHLKGTENGA